MSSLKSKPFCQMFFPMVFFPINYHLFAPPPHVFLVFPIKVHQLRDTQMTFSISTKSFENPRPCFQFDVQILNKISQQPKDVGRTPMLSRWGAGAILLMEEIRLTS